MNDLDAKMKELRAICDRLESGKLPLEQTLAEYARGVTIGHEIDAELARAEQVVEVIRPDGSLEPFPRSPGGDTP